MNQFYHNTTFIQPPHQNQKRNPHHFQKDGHQDDPLFVCLHFFKYNSLSILADNICFLKQIKNL